MSDESSAKATEYLKLQENGKHALRKAILDAASRILTSEGIRAMSMRRIAAAVGCSTQVLYTMFGSKNGIVDELYREGFARLHDRMKAVEPSEDIIEYLKQLCHVFRTAAIENKTYYGIMYQGHVADFRPSEESKSYAARALEIPVHALRRGMEAGTLKAENPEEMIRILFFAVNGFVSTEQAEYGLLLSPDRKEAIFNQILEIILGSLKKG